MHQALDMARSNGAKRLQFMVRNIRRRRSTRQICVAEKHWTGMETLRCNKSAGENCLIVFGHRIMSLPIQKLLFSQRLLRATRRLRGPVLGREVAFLHALVLLQQ
jgi:hypothetical protein